MTKSKQWEGHSGTVLDTVEGFDVIECETCHFKHITPIPSEQELERIYRQDYYAVEKPLYIERHRQDQDWWDLVYDERYEAFERLLPPSSRRILDVGSGPGLFMQRGKQRGWQTLGVEPSAQAAAHSSEMGLETIEGFLTAARAKELGKFDVIHLSDVLEHLRDPAEMLSITYQMLTPGGLICIVVPNDYNKLQSVLREHMDYKPWWVVPPHHINYFSFESLERLMQGAGFDIVQKTATFPMEMFLLMGDNYVGNDTLGRECHTKRKRLDALLDQPELRDFKSEVHQLMAKHGVGRESVIYGAKPIRGDKP